MEKDSTFVETARERKAELRSCGSMLFEFDGVDLICQSCGEHTRAKILRHAPACATKATIAGLSATERGVAFLWAEGVRTGEIARVLHISRKTVYSHKENIKTRLGLDPARETVVQLVRLVVEYEREQRERKRIEDEKAAACLVAAAGGERIRPANA